MHPPTRCRHCTHAAQVEHHAFEVAYSYIQSPHNPHHPRRGARADVPSPTSGRTAAHVAAAAGCLEILAVLMGHATAPDMDMVDAAGHSVFEYTLHAMELEQLQGNRRAAGVGGW